MMPGFRSHCENEVKERKEQAYTKSVATKKDLLDFVSKSGYLDKFGKERRKDVIDDVDREIENILSLSSIWEYTVNPRLELNRILWLAMNQTMKLGLPDHFFKRCGRN